MHEGEPVAWGSGFASLIQPSSVGGMTVPFRDQNC